MIFDSFPFFNEYELCDIRLNYLNTAVDAFIITESNLTWRCQPNNKKFNKVYKNLSNDIKKKIHYEFLEYSDDYIDSQEHANKKTIQDASRNRLGIIAQEIGSNNDIFFYSDLDEFWDKRELPTLVSLVNQHNYVVCNQDFRVVYVNWFARLREWPGTRITTIVNLDKKHPLSVGIFHHTKLNAFHRMHSHRSGWHFSYFGSVEQRTQKLKGIKDAQDWEKRKEKSYAEIANSVHSMQEWNSVARKKKINVRYNLPGIELDPELELLFKKYLHLFEE
jgi:hypothetical protein